MSAQIRRVNPNHQHPIRQTGLHQGSFEPRLESTFSETRNEWIRMNDIWENDPEQLTDFQRECRAGGYSFEDYDGPCPDDPNKYMPEHTVPEDQLWYQIFETVSDGTPISPPFETLEELVEWMVQPIDQSSPYNQRVTWLCSQGKSRAGAEEFCRVGVGWLPS